MKTLTFFYLTCIAFVSIMLASCEHLPELKPGTPEVCFDRDVMLIINSNCNVDGCHGGGEGPRLSTYDEVFRYVTPGDPRKSKLHKVITAGNINPNLMPPKPKSRLTSENIDIINIWILQGAKPNTATCP